MPRLNADLRTALAAVVSTLNTIALYSGTIPTTGSTAPTGTKLVEWPSTITWDGGVAGVNSISGGPISSDNALATGTAGYARVWDGTGASMYLTVGTSGAELNITSLSIITGTPVDIISGTVTMPAA
jgi:hypothetical protein